MAWEFSRNLDKCFWQVRIRIKLVGRRNERVYNLRNFQQTKPSCLVQFFQKRAVMPEKRKLHRFDLNLSVRIYSDEAYGEKCLEAAVRDISSGGAFINTPVHFPPGARLRMEVNMPQARFGDQQYGHSMLLGEGTVLRTSGNGFAVCFDQMCKLLPARI